MTATPISWRRFAWNVTLWLAVATIVLTHDGVFRVLGVIWMALLGVTLDALRFVDSHIRHEEHK